MPEREEETLIDHIERVNLIRAKEKEGSGSNLWLSHFLGRLVVRDEPQHVSIVGVPNVTPTYPLKTRKHRFDPLPKRVE